MDKKDSRSTPNRKSIVDNWGRIEPAGQDCTRESGEGGKDFRTRKQAGFLYQTQSPAEQRRLLDTILSNCTFDRGTLCPTYSKPFDLLAQGNELEIGGVDGARTRDLRRDRPAF